MKEELMKETKNMDYGECVSYLIEQGYLDEY